MKCKTIQKHIWSYIDAETEQSLNDKINKHLKKCDSCRLEYKELMTINQNIRNRLHVIPNNEPSPYLKAKLFDQIDNLKNKKLWYPNILKPAFISVALTILFGIVISFITELSTDNRTDKDILISSIGINNLTEKSPELLNNFIFRE